MNVFKRKTMGVSPSALKLIESHQPYQMGREYRKHTLWRLRELNNWDKHNFVIRTFLATHHGIEIEWTDDLGRPRRFADSRSEKIRRGDECCIGTRMGIRPDTELDINTNTFIVFEDITGLHSDQLIQRSMRLQTKWRGLLRASVMSSYRSPCSVPPLNPDTPGLSQCEKRLAIESCQLGYSLSS